MLNYQRVANRTTAKKSGIVNMAPELEGRVRTRKPLLLVGMSKRQAASVVLSVHSRKLWMKYNKYSMMNHNTLCELVLLLDQLVVVMWL